MLDKGNLILNSEVFTLCTDRKVKCLLHVSLYFFRYHAPLAQTSINVIMQ